VRNSNTVLVARKWHDSYGNTSGQILNQVEIWFSILVRRVIRRGSFTSKEDLRAKILNFINYFNEVLAKPFKWTFTGQVLKV
jgi:hypothetical protein